MARKRRGQTKSGGPRLKMSNCKFRTLIIIPMVVLALVAGLLNVVENVLGTTLTTYLGKGQSTVETPTEKQGWDGQYYEAANSGEDAKDEAYQVAAKVQDEGTVLLKNSDATLPLAKGSTVMPFGYGYLNPIYGQLSSGGSAKWSVDPVTPEQGLSAFNINNAAVDAMNANEVQTLAEAEGTSPAGEAGSMLGGDCKIYEYDPSIYNDVQADPTATGLVFITRAGQEGQDQKSDAYSDGTPHYLALSQNERGTIAAAKQKCGKVVVVLVGSAPMECGDLMSGDLAVDGILYYGHPGERGFSELSKLLDGDVNPSGRTVDTWSTDFTKDPSYASIGEHHYSNFTVTSGSLTDSGEQDRMYTEYMEGVYMGYRYYETAAQVDPNFDYSSEVVYPFGYGLSYTTFNQTLDSVTRADDGTITVTATVTNTGDVAGKDVVQVYYSAPYTQLDADSKVEKPACNLAAFDKTKLLDPGESQTITLTFDAEDMASYCYTHANPDGTTGCYLLEAGDYTISLRNNSHDVIASQTVTQDSTVWYDGSDNAHVRKSEKSLQSDLDDQGNAIIDGSKNYTAATNEFQQSSDYMNTDSTILSRTDWAGTQPQATDGKTISDEFKQNSDIFNTFDPETDPKLGNVEGSLVYAADQPTSGAHNGLVVSDLRGKSYNDPLWDKLLDQIDWDADRANIIQNFSGDAYTTAAIKSIGLPATDDEDGANGLKVAGRGMLATGQQYDMNATSSFGMQPLMGSTWNKELLYEVGHALGKEGVAQGVSGWYSPGINLHRSFFSGRDFEYYSEDPVLSGELAARAISGAGDEGMYCYLKHFALNETETGRSKLACFWCDEQAMRELYLKPFEIALRDGRMKVNYTADDQGTTATKVMRAGDAIMATQTCIGTTNGHCDYDLLTKLLRGEWGFNGMVISDYWVWNGDNLRDLCLRSGCDTYLSMNMPAMWNIQDYDSPTARTAMRQAIHRLAYVVANSNAMQGVVPGATVSVGAAWWQNAILAITIAVVALEAGGVVLIVRRSKAELANPAAYKRGKRAERKLQKRLAKAAKK